ncbi:MAG TPA: aldehyde dehydrogenase family protein, partial [Azospirillum sp.]|nr:aldehyde dehydrogenase family protein [Azospirillum sp.]
MTATAGKVLHFINGGYTAGSGARTFENRSPVDGSLISVVHEASRADVDAAVAAARAALTGPWGRMTQEERSAVLHKVADGITRRFDEFLAAECADTGKPRSLASHIDIPRGAANFKIFA